MASRYFAAGKIRAGWFHGRKLSQHKQERDSSPAPLARLSRRLREADDRIVNDERRSVTRR